MAQPRQAPGVADRRPASGRPCGEPVRPGCRDGPRGGEKKVLPAFPGHVTVAGHSQVDLVDQRRRGQGLAWRLACQSDRASSCNSAYTSGKRSVAACRSPACAAWSTADTCESPPADIFDPRTESSSQTKSRHLSPDGAARKRRHSVTRFPITRIPKKSWRTLRRFSAEELRGSNTVQAPRSSPSDHHDLHADVVRSNWEQIDHRRPGFSRGVRKPAGTRRFLFGPSGPSACDVPLDSDAWPRHRRQPSGFRIVRAREPNRSGSGRLCKRLRNLKAGSFAVPLLPVLRMN